MQTLEEKNNAAQGRCHRMRVPASLEGVAQVREGWAESLQGLDEATAHNLKVVMSEALGNAMEHGARNDPSQEITVSWSLLPQWLEITVEDPGLGFALADETAALRGRGRGLKLMGHYCDKIEHWVNPAGGHTLKLGKKMTWSAREIMGETLGDEKKTELAGLLQEMYGALGTPMAAAVIVEPLWSYVKKTVGEAMMIELRVERKYKELAQALEMYRGEVEDSYRETLNNELRYPVKLGRRSVGVLKATAGNVTQEQKELLQTLAVHVGLALGNERTQKQQAEIQEALNAMKMAANLQSRAKKLGVNVANTRGTVYAKEKRAAAVAGDVLESAVLADGSTVVLIADVMGKGVAAAFLSGIFRAGWHLLSRRQTHPLLLVKELNGFLYDELNGQTMFVTAALMHIDTHAEKISLVNAGHTAIYAQMKDGELKILEPSGPPLGLYPLPSWELMTLETQAVERIYMPTDGLYSWGEEAQKFTPKNLEKILKDSRKLSVEELWEELQRQRENAQEVQVDDQALIVWETAAAGVGTWAR